MYRGLLLFVAVCLLLPRAAAAQPSLSHSSPAALQPGKTVELTLHGTKLDDPLNVWTSFAAKVEMQPGAKENKDQKTRKCKITLEGNVPVSLGGIIVGTPAGASDVLVVMIDDLPNVADAGSNHSAETAQSMTLPAAIDGAADGPKFDYYKFAAKAGQRIAIEAVAARMASTMDPVLRLTDPAGNELVLLDDDESLGADCRFAFTCRQDGEYQLAIHDNQYRSGGRYRLRVGDFPLVSAPFPLGGRLGSTARFEFAGPSAEDAVPVLLRIPEADGHASVAIAAKSASGVSSGMAVLAATRLPEMREAEPNDAQKVSTPLTLPCAVSGILQQSGDRDYYTFAVTKGQPFAFRALTRSLGSPSLLFMRLYDASGKSLAETKVSDSDEFTLTHTFPADGMYCLMVQDLLRRGGPEHAYRVEMESNDGFTLSLKNDKATKLRFTNAKSTGACALDVQIARRGYDGPIEFSLAGDCQKCRLINPVAVAKSKSHRLIIAVDPDTAAGELQVVRLVGRATLNGRSLESIVETKAIVRTQRPQLAYPPAWLDGLLSVAIGAEAKPFFATKLSGESVAVVADSGKAEFSVAVERKEKEFKDGIVVILDGLPAEFTYSVKADKEKNNYTVTVNGPQGGAAAQFPFRVQSFAEFKGNGQISVSKAVLRTGADETGS